MDPSISLLSINARGNGLKLIHALGHFVVIGVLIGYNFSIGGRYIMEREFLEEREFSELLPGKNYKIFFVGNDCVIAETEIGDIVIAFSEYEYYSMSNSEIERKIYDGIKSRTR